VVLEKGLDGSLITILEDEGSAPRFLEKQARQKDLILDFSLVKSPQKIINPSKTKSLKVCLQGVNSDLIAQDHRQTFTNSKDGLKVEIHIEDLQSLKGVKNQYDADQNAQELKEKLTGYLVSTASIQSKSKEIIDQANKIVSSKSPDLDDVIKLVNWTADNINGTMKDSFSALEVLRSREGECQSHTRLYTAMARSVGIPTRIVTGLVYADNLGFLYHAWAESYVKGWLSVDPTLKQVPSDATHIKLASSGDDDPTSVLKMMGKVQIKSLEYQ